MLDCNYMVALPVPTTRELPTDRLVDVIIYTASLSSNPSAIGPLLDTLRNITIHRDSHSLTASDITTLHTLQQQLEAHLVTTEKIRAFDYESLHLHIQKRFTQSRSIGLPLTLAGIVSLSLTLFGGALLLPLPSTKLGLVALALMYTVLYVGAGWLFLNSTKELTPSARKAYRLIAAAIMIRGAFVLIQPMVGIIGIEKEPYAPLIIELPLIATYIVLFIGTKRVAVLAGAAKLLVSRRTTGIILACFAAGAVLLSTFLGPLLGNSLPLPYAIGAVIAEGYSGILLGIIAYNLMKVEKMQTVLYSHATRALVIAIAANVLNKVFFTTYYVIRGDLSSNPWLIGGFLLLLVVAVLYIRAGYLFNKINKA